MNQSLRALLLFVLFASAALLPGCGGSGGDEGVVVPREQQVVITTTLDHYLRSNGTFGDLTANGLAVGDNGPDGLRAFIFFSLSSVPTDATIVSAVVHLRHVGGHVGSSPYAAFGTMILERVFPPQGAALGTDAYDLGPLSAAVEISNNELEGPRDLDVTPLVLAARLDGRSFCWFRLRFLGAPNNDGRETWVRFEDSLNHLGRNDPPTLTVTYR